MYFEYGAKEIDYIRSKDAKMGEYIDRIGHLHKSVDSDLFSSVVLNIIGQQISMKAQETIWARMNDDLKEVTPQAIAEAGIDRIQSYGTSFKKAGYIYNFAQKILNGEFDLEAIWDKPDEEVIKELSSLNGIGEWTAEMIMLFCMQRPNIFSFKDLAIQRRLRMVYHHRKITKELFEKYRRRFSPYCSVVSLYLWDISLGAIPKRKDHAPKTKKVQKNGKS